MEHHTVLMNSGAGTEYDEELRISRVIQCHDTAMNLVLRSRPLKVDLR